MVKFSKYNVILEHKIILEYYYGPTNVDDLIALRKRLAQDKDFNPQFNLLIDLRDAAFEINWDKLHVYNDFIKANPIMIGKRFVSLLTDVPISSLGLVLSTFNQGDLPIRVNIYNTMDSAIKWIDLSEPGRKYLEEVIHEMKNFI